MAKAGLVGTVAKAALAVRRAAKDTARKTAAKASQRGERLKDLPPPSPNPMTNLVIADVAMRGGGALLRRAIETAVLGVKYSDKKAKNIVKGRGLTDTLLGTMAARIATRSVPGAIIVGGGLLAKTLYDRSKGAQAAREGEQAMSEQAKDGAK
jgi:hypothetical protein